MTEYLCQIPSPLCLLYAIGNEAGLSGLWMAGEKYQPPGITELPEKPLPVFDQTRRWLDVYFSGKEPDFLPALAPAGGEFRQAVWKLLLDIPYGKLTTYGALAREIEKQRGRRVSAQAVGNAVGHNPVSIIIPCHRVVGADGSLTGYAGGIDKKLRLLELEKAPLDGLYIPKKGTAL